MGLSESICQHFTYQLNLTMETCGRSFGFQIITFKILFILFALCKVYILKMTIVSCTNRL